VNRDVAIEDQQRLYEINDKAQQGAGIESDAFTNIAFFD
jgi:hypothetical protein